jgi:hypothetical protein
VLILPVRREAVTDAQAQYLTAQPGGLPLGARFPDTRNGVPGARTNGAPGGARRLRSPDLSALGCSAGREGWLGSRERGGPVKLAG